MSYKLQVKDSKKAQWRDAHFRIPFLKSKYKTKAQAVSHQKRYTKMAKLMTPKKEWTYRTRVVFIKCKK